MSAAEQGIRTVLAPLLGCAGFAYETLRDGEPRWLIVSAAVGLAVGQPVARLLDGRKAPAAPTEPDQPRTPADPTGGPS